MTLHRRIDEILQGAIRPGGLPCAAMTVFDRDGVLLESAAGRRSEAGGEAMTIDSVLWIASLTKALTAAAAMQCVERGLLDLDAPTGELQPWLAEAPVLEGFDAEGTPQLRPHEGTITLRNLLTHTAGFGYIMWNADLLRHHQAGAFPALNTRKLAALKQPLSFDPGTDWQYSIAIDWAGVLVETVTGAPLGDWMRDHIFGPLGMDSTGFEISDDMRARLVLQRSRDGDGFTETAPLPPPEDPEFDLGGGGLYSTVRDYARFARMILRGGELDGARVLQPETVAEMSRNNMGELRVKLLPSAMAAVTNDAEFFPGVPKTWGLSFMINDEDAPTGRPAGSLAWAGLANSYYWIDAKNGIGGVFSSQLFPFVDHVALPLYLEAEKAVYESL